MVISSEHIIGILNNLEKMSKLNFSNLKSIISENKICYETDFDGKISLDGFLEKSDIFRKFIKLKVKGQIIDLTLMKEIYYDRTRKRLILTTIYENSFKISVDNPSEVEISLDNIPIGAFLKYFN